MVKGPGGEGGWVTPAPILKPGLGPFKPSQTVVIGDRKGPQSDGNDLLHQGDRGQLAVGADRVHVKVVMTWATIGIYRSKNLP